MYEDELEEQIERTMSIKIGGGQGWPIGHGLQILGYAILAFIRAYQQRTFIWGKMR